MLVVSCGNILSLIYNEIHSTFTIILLLYFSQMYLVRWNLSSNNFIKESWQYSWIFAYFKWFDWAFFLKKNKTGRITWLEIDSSAQNSFFESLIGIDLLVFSMEFCGEIWDQPYFSSSYLFFLSLWYFCLAVPQIWGLFLNFNNLSRICLNLIILD